MPMARVQKRASPAASDSNSFAVVMPSQFMNTQRAPNRILKPSPALRRSARLHKIKEARAAKSEQESHPPLPPSASPLSSPSKLRGGRKRKNLESSEVVNEHSPPSKTRIVQGAGTPSDEFGYPILHWLETAQWPLDFAKREVDIDQMSPDKRKTGELNHSETLDRLREHGIHLEQNAKMVQKSSIKLCKKLLKGRRRPILYACYPPNKVSEVLARVCGQNEGRLRRDVTPWVVPSPENLVLCGDSIPNWIGEEVETEWTRCMTIGGTQPKPDLAVGLQSTAFTQDELARLYNFANLEQPFFFTSGLSFPFLICEVKTGLAGLETADRQNIHSAAIAVRAIIRLAEAAYGEEDKRVKDLHGQLLVFTVSHNNQLAAVYGHYALAGEDGGLEFFRHGIALKSFDFNNGSDRYGTYGFVHKLYKKFAPQHRKRIKEAALCLPDLGPRAGPSVAESECP